jgi:hypothetical protein
MEYMKRAAVVLLTVFLLGFAPKALAVETFLGDFCWNVVFPSEPGFPAMVKLGVFEKDNAHFALYGTVDFGDGTGAINGNAEVVGGQILVTATEADVFVDVDPFVVASIIQATLDASTLGGTIHILEIEQNLNTEVVSTFGDTGTMTLTACP